MLAHIIIKDANMIKYIKIYNEFKNFLRESDINAFSEYEKKLINIIIDNFDKIARIGTRQGKRGILLNELILEKGKIISSDFLIPIDSIEKSTFPFECLTSIELKNFRGFSNYEKIDFSKKYTFIYGPNGSGKSSLCEALEYSMLGYINEAILKRISIEQYRKNTITGKYNTPILKGKHNNQIINIIPNTSLYHFCFIEKCRIENFARISANTPSEKNNLLSILFGLSEFNEFVNEFTDKIENYVDIEGKKNNELKSKSESIKFYEENIKKEKTSLNESGSKKSDISSEAKLNKSFDDLDLYIHGTEKQEGRISIIEKELSKPTLIKYEIPTFSTLKSNLSEIQFCITEYQNYQAEYKEKKDAVRFKELYDLVITLQPIAKDKCPVCETPIKNTVKHPYENAQTKLNELQYIAKLENDLEKSKDDLSEKLELFRKNLEKRIEVSKNFILEKSFNDIQLNRFEFKDNIYTYAKKLIEIFTNVEKEHNTFENIISKHNADVDAQNIIRGKLSEEKKNLNSISEKIKQIKTFEKSKLENIEKWQKVVDQFKDENKTLIDDAEKENEQINLNKKYVTAYKTLLRKLKDYKENLPLKHVAKLNELTVELYNQINIHDKDFEILSKISLPSKPDDSIFIYFESEPNKPYDALQILSEGHIRCLGLSILLSKNIQEGYPVIIFDDVANAIDDDHRGGIRKLLFNNENLDSKQIILTTHSSQFIKDLEQYPSKSEYDNNVNKFLFLPDEHSRKIRIKPNDFQNYIFKANKYYKESNYSEALYFCRCGIENISHRLWNRFGRKKYKTEFKVVIRSPNSVPDLMSVVISLNKFIKANIDKNGDYKTVTDIFDFLIGLEKKSNIIWEYLNKGTHEESDRDEFDQLIVLEIINKLTELDDFVKCG